MLQLPAMYTKKIIIALLGPLVAASPIKINLPPQKNYEEAVQMLFTVKGRINGKTVTIESDYDSFLSQFYGCDEKPEQDQDGVYIVDDESIEATIKEYPEVIVDGGRS